MAIVDSPIDDFEQAEPGAHELNRLGQPLTTTRPEVTSATAEVGAVKTAAETLLGPTVFPPVADKPESGNN